MQPLGQINLDSSLGQHIYKLTILPDTKNIIDIGTWNGFGSTLCVIQAIIDTNKQNYQAISIEANYKQFLLAKSNLALYEKYINILYGRITNIEDLISLNDYDDTFFKLYSRQLQEQWYAVDVKQHTEAPNIYNNIIQKISHIDLLILDGGEYCSYGEFLKLEPISKIIVLDDINTIKNHKAALVLRNSKDHKILYDNPNSRNGYLIAQKI